MSNTIKQPFTADYVRSTTLASSKSYIEEEIAYLEQIIMKYNLGGFNDVEKEYETRLCNALANELKTRGFITEVKPVTYVQNRSTLIVRW